MRYVIDIDGTIAITALGPDDKYVVFEIKDKMVDKINDLYDEGHTIILYTGRHWDKLDETIAMLDDAGVDYDTLVMGKPTGDVYVDDKAVRPDEFLDG